MGEGVPLDDGREEGECVCGTEPEWHTCPHITKGCDTCTRAA